MARKRSPREHLVPSDVVRGTVVRYAGESYRVQDDGLGVVGGKGGPLELGSWAARGADGWTIRLTPGAQTYLEARSHHSREVLPHELVAAAIVAAVAGHPSATAARAGTRLSAVWSLHLAIVLGEDPRRVATTYAPTETKTISAEIQHMAAVGIEVAVDA